MKTFRQQMVIWIVLCLAVSVVGCGRNALRTWYATSGPHRIVAGTSAMRSSAKMMRTTRRRREAERLGGMVP